MTVPTSPRGYSANIRMQLRLNVYVFYVAQLGPDFLILDNPTDLPPGLGEIEMWIDGRHRRWTVQVPAGVRAGERETKITRLA
jgi:hypothetical protein